MIPYNLFDDDNSQQHERQARKKNCQFKREIYYGGACKTCLYNCPGYGGPVTFPQAKDKQCPPIGSNGLVDTSFIDPTCRY